MDLPIITKTVYPFNLLDDLKKAILDAKDISQDYTVNRSKFKNLQDTLAPVMDIRNKAMEIPSDIDFESLLSISDSATIKKVELDMRAEYLISKNIELQGKLINVI